MKTPEINSFNYNLLRNHNQPGLKALNYLVIDGLRTISYRDR